MDDLEKSTGVSNPLVLLQSMIDRGNNPETLGKMMDLAERWQANQSLAAFSVAMNACQAEMPLVLQDSENLHTKSRYASLEAVNRVCKPCYTRHGFSIQFAEGEAKNPEEVRIVADVLHAAGHERRYFIDLARDGVGMKGGQMMTPLQGKGSTFSYGQRYLVKMIFNLTIAGEDTDGGSPGSLTDDQVVTLNELLGGLRALAGESTYEKWLPAWWKWLDCKDGLNDLKPSNYEKAKLDLEGRIKKFQGAKP